MRLKTCTSCGQPFAPSLARQARCETCMPAGRDARSPTTRAQDAEYAAERARVLAGHPLCAYGCGRPATTVDHVDPVARGGRHRGNLVPACAHCNFSKQDAPVPRPGAAPAPSSPPPRSAGCRLA